MSSNLFPKDQELYRRADEVLHYIWDPIGIAGEPAARDEYNSYASTVFSLLDANATADRIADHLNQITTEALGLSSRRDHDFKIAQILIEWKDTLER